MTQASVYGGPATTYAVDGVGNRIQTTGGADAGQYTMDASTPAPADFHANQYTTTPFDLERTYDVNGNLMGLGRPAGTSRGADGCSGVCGVDDDGNAQTDDGCEFCPRGSSGAPVAYGDDVCSSTDAPLAVISYDYRNQMVLFGGPGGCGASAAFAYDAFGRRIQAGGTQYFNDGSREIEERGGDGSAIIVYIYGSDIDEVLRQDQDIDADGTFDLNYYYYADDLFNVTAVANPTGGVVERYDYDPFGRPRFFDWQNAPLAQSAIGNPILFNGRRYDPLTGFYDYRSRYFDPRAGRFTSNDTVGRWSDPMSLGNGSTYVGNNPWTHRDPMGEGADWCKSLCDATHWGITQSGKEKRADCYRECDKAEQQVASGQGVECENGTVPACRMGCRTHYD
jgi:RHS repeat-associated protein